MFNTLSQYRSFFTILYSYSYNTCYYIYFLFVSVWEIHLFLEFTSFYFSTLILNSMMMKERLTHKSISRDVLATETELSYEIRRTNSCVTWTLKICIILAIIYSCRRMSLYLCIAAYVIRRYQ